MSVEILPSVNALLNAGATTLLVVGRILIARGRRDAHRRVMIGALVLSVLFLASYLVYHYHAGSTRYEGPARPLYLFILLTHIVLAAVVPPLAIVTVVQGLRQRFDRHRRIARITWPIWMYVSVTGVVIYLMLYHL